jgi:integrase
MTRNDKPRQKTRNTAILPKEHLRYWRQRIFRQDRSPYYFVQIQCRGERHAMSLGTSNPDAAAARARDIYQQVKANGWEATLSSLQQERDGLTASTQCTLGAYIDAAKATADIAPRTLETYCRAVRKIASDMLRLPDDNTRCDKIGGGYDAWLNKVGTFKLAQFTPAKIAAWKKSYLERAKSDPVSQRAARVSAAYYLRNSKALFGAKIREHIGLALPEPLPFAGVQIERPSAKYFATFDLEKLIQNACGDLAESDQEAFKVLLLSGMVGLRRKEIDLLPWSAFRWDDNVIRVQHTAHFSPKTDDSVDDVAVDPELMTVFRGYRARAPKAEFVIASENAPRPGVLYSFYRCDDVFDRLSIWLREHDVKSVKPIHELRKAFGSLICQKAGIHQASRALRHSDIRTTSAVYVDSRSRVSAGLGHLLTRRSIQQGSFNCVENRTRSQKRTR